MCFNFLWEANMAAVVDVIRNGIEPLLQTMDMELYDIEFEKEGKNYFLRIFIDNESGITLENCIETNAMVVDFLEKSDPISQEYMLEVTSPGVIRKLKNPKHFEKQIGKVIMVKTYKPIEENGSKTLESVLTKVNNDGIVLGELQVKYSEISKAETTFDFKGEKK